MENKENCYYTKMVEDIATLKADVKYIKEIVLRLDKPNPVNSEKINTNRKIIYFLFAVVGGIISYLTGIKFIWNSGTTLIL